MRLVVGLVHSWVILLTGLHIDGPVVRITLPVAFGRNLPQAKVDGHQIIIFIVGVCDTRAAVTQPEAPQPLGQVAGKGSSTAFADNRTVGSVDLSAEVEEVNATEKGWGAGEMTQQLKSTGGKLGIQLTLYPYQGEEAHNLLALPVLAS